MVSTSLDACTALPYSKEGKDLNKHRTRAIVVFRTVFFNLVSRQNLVTPNCLLPSGAELSLHLFCLAQNEESWGSELDDSALDVDPRRCTPLRTHGIVRARRSPSALALIPTPTLGCIASRSGMPLRAQRMMRARRSQSALGVEEQPHTR